jgi:hypothetical protein
LPGEVKVEVSSTPAIVDLNGNESDKPLMESESTVSVTNSESPKRQPTKKSQFLLKRLQLQDISDNQQEPTEDKFTSIKMRRSKNSPTVPTPPKIKGKKKMPYPIKEEPSEIVCFVSESTAQPEDKMLSLLQISSPSCIQESPKNDVDSQNDSYTEFVPPDIEMAIYPQLEGITAIQQLEGITDTLPSSPSKNESLNTNVSPIKKQCVIANETSIVSESSIKTDEELEAEHKLGLMNQLRFVTVSLTRLTPSKINKIVGGRMSQLKNVTKSGRILKPKDRLDPSPKKPKRRKGKVMKIKIVPKKKSHDETEEKLRKKRGRKKKFIAQTETVAMAEWEVPDDIPMDIMEDYVDFSSDSTREETSQGMEVTQKIEIEFLSPNFKHKGKVIIGGKLFDIVSRLPGKRRGH